MSRYRNIIKALIGRVRSISPEYSADLPYLCAEDSDGGVQAPYDWILNPQRRTREFDIRSTEFTYPGPGCNVLTPCVIRVVYELTTDLGFLDQMINSDLLAVINQVIYSTEGWGTYANSVYMEDGAAPVAEIVSDGNDNPVTVVVSIPIVLDYRRTEN